jgi:hypothetical protein
MKLTFEQVDRIQAAVGKNNYYRAFQVEENSWVVYVHEFDQLRAARGFRTEPLVYTTSTFEMAQAFAQAFEDDADEKNTSKRVARATRVACGIEQEG